jgi:hypothetical protein
MTGGGFIGFVTIAGDWLVQSSSEEDLIHSPRSAWQEARTRRESRVENQNTGSCDGMNQI